MFRPFQTFLSKWAHKIHLKNKVQKMPLKQIIFKIQNIYQIVLQIYEFWQ